MLRPAKSTQQRQRDDEQAREQKHIQVHGAFSSFEMRRSFSFREGRIRTVERKSQAARRVV